MITTIRFHKRLFYVLLLTLSSRAIAAPLDAELLSENLNSSLACSQFRDLFWNELYRQVQRLDNKNFQNEKSFSRISSGDAGIDQAATALIKLLVEEAPTLMNAGNRSELLELLTSIELGDQSTPTRKYLFQKTEAHLLKLERLSKQLQLACENEDEKKILKKNRAVNRAAIGPGLGVRKTLATFYQSCAPLTLAPLKYEDPNVSGISITGTHSDGTGKKRVVSSVTKVNSTHHYLKNMPAPVGECRDVKLSPPIYDYGGKPYTTSALDSSLDFFKNAGSGTSAMGTDCSGLVFSNLAAAGLKLKSSTALKAISVNGISSTMLSNPSSNGLDCLEKVTFSETETIREGDIISKPGHTVSVYSVGTDPFGIAGITKLSDCTSSKISSSRYNFSVVQSSPIKNGIGVNRIPAYDYIRLTSSWSSGFTFYALKACRAKFGVYSSSASSDKLAIVRHKGTSECLAEPIALTGEGCAAACSL